MMVTLFCISVYRFATANDIMQIYIYVMPITAVQNSKKLKLLQPLGTFEHILHIN